MSEPELPVATLAAPYYTALVVAAERKVLQFVKLPQLGRDRAAQLNAEVPRLCRDYRAAQAVHTKSKHVHII